MTQIILRDYQKQDASRIVRAAMAGERVMYTLPTGGGKTEIGLEVSRQWIANGGTVVWLTHIIELIDQSIARADNFGLNVNVTYDNQIYMQKKFNVQSIGKARNNRPPSVIRGKQVLLIFDEAHHATAKTWERIILKHKGAVCGLTATPWRLSKKEGFDHLYDVLIQGPSYSRLIADGYLMSPTVIAPVDHQNRLEGKSEDVVSTGEYSMSRIVERYGRAVRDIPVMYYHKYCSDRPTLIFAATQAVAVDIASDIASKGKRVGLLLSDAELKEKAPDWIETDRATVTRRFGKGDLDVVVNVKIITEGYDCPGAEAAIIGHPTKSLALVRQITGRVLRVATNKKHPVVVDCGGSIANEEVGYPTGDYEWSLEPRVSGKGNGVPPTVVCDNCETVNYISSRKCSNEECHKWFGSFCPRCHEFRHRWFFHFGCIPHCEDCEFGIREVKNLVNSLSPKVGKLIENEGFWSKKSWEYALCMPKHTAEADWERVNAMYASQEWGIVVPQVLPLGQVRKHTVARKSGKRTVMPIVSRWNGMYNGKPSSICEIAKS